MILKALTLENFKGIREPVRIEFAPLTLLFGPNNAGKSTIVQALMYAREVLERNNCDAGRTELGGDVVDLGGFGNLVHGRDFTRKIRMRFEMEGVRLPGYLEPETEDLIDQYVRDPMNKEAVDSRLPLPSIDEISAGLSQIWVQIEVGWSTRSAKPVVKQYQVGTGNHAYATIDLYSDGFSRISHFDFWTHPFGNTTPVFTHLLDLSDLPPDDYTDYMLDTTGKFSDAPPMEVPAHGPAEPAPPPVEIAGRLRHYATVETKETNGWLGDIYGELIVRDFSPFGKEGAIRLPLQLNGTALPDWESVLPVARRVWQTYKKDESRVFSDPGLAQEYLIGVLSAIIVGPGERLTQALRESMYMGPFRRMPSRNYRPSQPIGSRTWADGLAAWDLLMSKDMDLVAVNDWLIGKQRFDAGYEIVIAKHRELPEDGELWRALVGDDHPAVSDRAWIKVRIDALVERRRLELVERRSGIKLVPQDLGVGISQVIPVIVAALHSKSGVVAIEEPESNIHPAFQVVLADLFISQAKANPGAMFLVETHSEHLMLRCLRRIRETAKGVLPEGIPAVTPEDIAVHFVESTDSRPRIRRIEIDEDGDFIDEWPGGFFEESYREKFAGR